MIAIIIVAIVCITIVFLANLGYRSKESTILELYEKYLEEVGKRVDDDEESDANVS